MLGWRRLTASTTVNLNHWEKGSTCIPVCVCVSLCVELKLKTQDDGNIIVIIFIIIIFYHPNQHLNWQPVRFFSSSRNCVCLHKETFCWLRDTTENTPINTITFTRTNLSVPAFLGQPVFQISNARHYEHNISIYIFHRMTLKDVHNL